METVKVDIKKLQLLNDRINQCIDALSQVRLSVHGLSHTSGLGQGVPFAGVPPFQAGIPPFQAGIPPFQTQATGLGYSPFGQTPSAPSFIPGISHTTPMGVNPFGGLESPDAFARPLWADPLLASRIAQTFPYAQAVVPPQVAGY